MSEMSGIYKQFSHRRYDIELYINFHLIFYSYNKYLLNLLIYLIFIYLYYLHVEYAWQENRLKIITCFIITVQTVIKLIVGEMQQIISLIILNIIEIRMYNQLSIVFFVDFIIALIFQFSDNFVLRTIFNSCWQVYAHTFDSHCCNKCKLKWILFLLAVLPVVCLFSWYAFTRKNRNVSPYIPGEYKNTPLLAREHASSWQKNFLDKIIFCCIWVTKTSF